MENYVRSQIPRQELVTVLDNIGLPYSSINNTYTTSGSIGTSDAEILFSLNQEHHHPTAGYVKQLREELPRQFPGVEFFFQPADIVSQILNFGLPSPIDIQIVGKNQAQNYQLAQELANQLRHVPGAADVHVQQLMNSPALRLNVDRTRAQQVGLQQRDVAQNLLVSLSGSFQTAPTFWLNRENGVTYNVAVQTPEYRVDSLQALMDTPDHRPRSACAPGAGKPGHRLSRCDPGCDLSLQHPTSNRCVYQRARTRSGRRGARYPQDRGASFEKKLPRGSRIEIRGQVETMSSSFAGLALGLVMSIVLVYLLIVVNFQSWLDPFIIITALPGALLGSSGCYC